MTELHDLEDSLAVLDDPCIEAFGMLIEANNELHNAVTTNLKQELSVPIPWLGVLIRLARSPGHRLRMTHLAREMTMSTSGLTRLVDRIEAAGHVRRESCPEDKRGLLAVLTPDGHRLIAAAAPMHVADLDRCLGAALSPQELTQLTDLLRTVRDHVRSLDRDG